MCLRRAFVRDLNRSAPDSCGAACSRVQVSFSPGIRNVAGVLPASVKRSAHRYEDTSSGSVSGEANRFSTCTLGGVVGKKFQMTDPNQLAEKGSALRTANEQCGWKLTLAGM